ncbi:MAG: Na+/H+ antiporter [Verrucomicrobiota bacterium]
MQNEDASTSFPRVEQAELLILLLISLAGFGLLAKRLRVPEPIILVLGGLVLSLIPGLPEVELQPEYVFLIVLPPLLYAQAWFTSWKDFCDNLRSISMLAVGLVLATTTAVALVAHALVPTMPLAACFVLGAIISPPDAVAASAIAQRLKLPKKMVTILEGESLVNDATGLVAYKFALAAVATGSFSLAHASGQFLLVAVGGVVVGLVVAWIFHLLLRWIRDDLIDIVLSLVALYAAYIGAERLHVSGVLATVTAGIWLGARSPEMLSASTRLTATAFWNTLVFLLNGVVFMLIGLQLPRVVSNLSERSWPMLLCHAAILGGVVILTRIIWVFPGAILPRKWSARIRARDPMPPMSNIAVIAWCGMRGVVSLAAALAIPHIIAPGKTFPERDLILFFTFCIILITLVGQGLSLPWVIRKLKVQTGHSDEHQEREARTAATHAALARIETFAAEEKFTPEAIKRVESLYQERLHHFGDEIADTLGWSPERQHSIETRRLRRTAVEAERKQLIAMHREHKLSKELLHRLEHELDLEEARLAETSPTR